MKKNFRVWLIVVASLTTAIVFFVAAGVFFSRPLESGEPIPPYVRIISCVLLCMAGFATMWIFYTSIYGAGKGKILNVSDLRPEISHLRGQAFSTDGRAIATIEYATGEIRSVMLSKSIEEPLPECVIPATGEILVSADYYKKKETKPVQAKPHGRSPKDADGKKTTEPERKTEEGSTK
ncbi:hypothetical protein KKC65_00155 [Patescibacteria group bacterium]|nr:hypothetical protein [Patescibacteria group bacterium]